MNPRFSGGFIFTVFKEIAMKRTTNYALPDWEKSDFIQMSDFNDLTHKLDTALKSHDDTLNTKADASSVTAVQQEVAAAREANCLVKLAGPLVTTTANAAMEFDLSQVDMTKVAALFVVFSVGASSGTASVSANDSVVSTICSNNGSTSAGIVWLVPLNGKVGAFSANAVSRSGLSTANSGTNSAVEWTALNKVTIGGASYSGATATLFAVKK